MQRSKWKFQRSQYDFSSAARQKNRRRRKKKWFRNLKHIFGDPRKPCTFYTSRGDLLSWNFRAAVIATDGDCLASKNLLNTWPFLPRASQIWEYITYRTCHSQVEKLSWNERKIKLPCSKPTWKFFSFLRILLFGKRVIYLTRTRGEYYITQSVATL